MHQNSGGHIKSNAFCNISAKELRQIISEVDTNPPQPSREYADSVQKLIKIRKSREFVFKNFSAIEAK